jgi:hypothetical protein
MMDEDDAADRQARTRSRVPSRHGGSRRSKRRLHALAERLIACEAMTRDPSAPAPAAFSAVVERLRPPLTGLSGRAGFSSLLARALTLASREARWLRAVRVNAEGALEYPAGIAPGQGDIVKAEVALIVQVLALLVSFIGEPLTLGLVQDVWPTAHIDDLGKEEA